MSYIQYISLPRKPSALPKPAEGEERISKSGIYHYPDTSQGYGYLYMCLESPSHEGGIYFGEIIENAVFGHCFKNPIVYGFAMDSMVGTMERCEEVSRSDMSYEAKDLAVKKIHDENEHWRRQKLYECLHLLLNIGEFVEIFTGWLPEVGFVFPPPVAEQVIDVEDILCYDPVKSQWKAVTYQWGYEHLLTIRRTV